MTAASSGWGTAGPAAAAEWRLRLGTGPYGFHETAADRAVRQFLGPPDAAETDPGDGEPRPGRPRIRPGGGAQVRLGALHEIALVYRAERPVPGGGVLRFGGELALGEARYRLPDGIGVLRDPMGVRFRHVALTPMLGIGGGPARLGRLDVAGEAGLGWSLLRTETRMRSALIDLRRVDGFSEPFVFTALRLGVAAAPQAALEFGLRWSEQAGAEVRLGLSHAF